ncbi:MAG TPA: glycosyltransferase family 4 protein [Candidatus Limnocylindrales bacterium]|nr:glycosyltransferase family 4 protein [Candidatus Limnocylindrales bacterium]
MLVHAYYDEDPRVRREAESLVAAGRPVDVFGLRREGDPPHGELDGVSVHRLGVRRHQGAGLPTYLAEYVSFVARASRALARAHPRRRYALVQVHTPPDFLAVAAVPLRLAGVPLLLDLHEAMPEFFRSRFPRASNPVVHAALRLTERVSIRLASAAVTVNPAMRDRLVAEVGVAASKVSVVANSPTLARFDPSGMARRTFAADGVVRLVYAGALTPVYEVDVAIDAVAELRSLRPNLEVAFDVYGRGDAADRLADRARERGVAERIAFHGRIPIEDVPAAIARADIGIAPTRRDPFTDVSLSTKVFEYAAMGKPVVASRLPMVEHTFPPGTVVTYEAGDAAGMAQAILRIVDDPLAREAMVERTAAIVAEHAWEREAPDYLALVDRLARDTRTA